MLPLRCVEGRQISQVQPTLVSIAKREERAFLRDALLSLSLSYGIYSRGYLPRDGEAVRRR